MDKAPFWLRQTLRSNEKRRARFGPFSLARRSFGITYFLNCAASTVVRMLHLSSFSGFCAIALWTAGAISPGVTQADDIRSLLQNSPFGAAEPAPVLTTAPSTLEFRGVFADRGEYFFSMYETTTHYKEWVGLNETGKCFTPRSYNADKQTVTGEYGGRTVTLTLVQAKIVGTVPPGVTPPQGNATEPVARSPQPPTGLAAGVQVIEDVQRRRAVRQQGLAAQNKHPGPEIENRPALPR